MRSFRKIFMGLLLSGATLGLSSEAFAQSDCSEIFGEELRSYTSYDLTIATEKTKEIMDTVIHGCRLGAQFCAGLSLRATWKLPGIALRAVTFTGTYGRLRKGIILPLAKHIKKINDPTLNEKDRMKAYQDFVIFWPEAVYKIYIAIPVLTTQMGFDSLAGGISAKSDGSKAAALKFLKAFWREARSKENSHLPFGEKLKGIVLRSSADVGDQVTKDLGIDVLKEALALEGPPLN